MLGTGSPKCRSELQSPCLDNPLTTGYTRISTFEMGVVCNSLYQELSYNHFHSFYLSHLHHLSHHPSKFPRVITRLAPACASPPGNRDPSMDGRFYYRPGRPMPILPSSSTNNTTIIISDQNPSFQSTHPQNLIQPNPARTTTHNPQKHHTPRFRQDTDSSLKSKHHPRLKRQLARRADTPLNESYPLTLGTPPLITRLDSSTNLLI